MQRAVDNAGRAQYIDMRLCLSAPRIPGPGAQLAESRGSVNAYCHGLYRFCSIVPLKVCVLCKCHCLSKSKRGCCCATVLILLSRTTWKRLTAVGLVITPSMYVASRHHVLIVSRDLWWISCVASASSLHTATRYFRVLPRFARLSYFRVGGPGSGSQIYTVRDL